MLSKRLYFSLESQQIIVAVTIYILTRREPQRIIIAVVLFILLSEMALSVIDKETGVRYIVIVVSRECSQDIYIAILIEVIAEGCIICYCGTLEYRENIIVSSRVIDGYRQIIVAWQHEISQTVTVKVRRNYRCAHRLPLPLSITLVNIKHTLPLIHQICQAIAIEVCSGHRQTNLIGGTIHSASRCL